MLEKMLQGRSDSFKKEVNARILRMNKSTTLAGGEIISRQIFALVIMHVEDLDLNTSKSINPIS